MNHRPWNLDELGIIERFWRIPQGRLEIVGLRESLPIGSLTYIEMAYIIRKGDRSCLQSEDIDRFRRGLAETMPELADRVGELKSFDDIKFLEVQVNRARRWHLPGLLLIRDAAHAMSPMSGVSVNYAVQDAVAAAYGGESGIQSKPLRRLSIVCCR